MSPDKASVGGALAAARGGEGACSIFSNFRQKIGGRNNEGGVTASEYGIQSEVLQLLDRWCPSRS